MMIEVEKPTLRRKEMDAVLQTMANEQIGVGEYNQHLIESFEAYSGKGVSFTFRTPIDALSYALRALSLERGSQIAIGALSPLYYRYVIEKEGFVPLILDVDSDTGLLSIELLSAHLSKLSAIVLFDISGSIALDQRWSELTLPIIEDCTESLGSTFFDRKGGDLGSIVLCNFEENNLISTAGGAIVHTKDELYTENLTKLVKECAPLLTLVDLNAALGVVQFVHLERNILRRRAIYKRYVQAILRSKHTYLGVREIDFEPNGVSFIVLLDSKPEEAQKFALKYQIETTLAFNNCVIKENLEEFEKWPVAIPMVLRAVKFPLYPFLSNKEITQIEKVLSYVP